MTGSSTGVTLDAGEVDSLRRLVAKSDIARACGIQVADITLDGSIELACSWWQWQQTAPQELLARLEEWSRRHPLLGYAWAALRTGKTEAVEPHGAPAMELRVVPRLPDTMAGVEWFLFADRFRRSLCTRGGFNGTLARGLAAAMGEMTDNVAQHSSASVQTAAPGIVAYQVSRGRMTYSVGDVGRGALNSLRTNPQWSHLRDSAAALDAAIRRSATSRQGQAGGIGGGGFREVHKSLADLNGRLRFRTGDAVLELDGQGDARRSAQRNSPPLVGFQMSVSCSIPVV